MDSPDLAARPFEPPARARFRILSIDGGGIRGLIPAIVLRRLEELIRERDPEATLASSFELIAGTSTGGLIALGLTTPDGEGSPAIGPAEMIELYTGDDARRIFSRPPLERLPGIGFASELFDPKYGLDELRETLERRLGDRTIGEALTGVLLSAYDMHDRAPRFFKRWGRSATSTVVEAGLATSAAPTYFPALQREEEALVDGGVFVNNPTIAAAIEALKRTEGEPIRAEDLLVVSLGTGRHERGYEPSRVAGWGSLGWILPAEGEPPLIGAMLDGQSDAADHWAHVLLNHDPGGTMASGEAIGAGPRYYRWQIDLPRSIPLDGVEASDLALLERCGEALVAGRAAELAAVAAALST